MGIVEAAVIAERERIIKLLNTELSRHIWDNVGAPVGALAYSSALASAIAIIKDSVDN